MAVVWHQVSAKTSLASIGASAILDGVKVTGATVLCALLFGLFPALRTTAISTVDVLRSE
jgi:ABC-type antimicrobial peptide transport system permease subunit